MPCIWDATDKHILVQDACQPKTVIQPWNHVLITLIRGGARIAVQWYWAPANGHMDAISAMDNAMAMVPINESTMPHTRPAGPPLASPGA